MIFDLTHLAALSIGWTWEPSVLLGLAAWTAGYVVFGSRMRRGWPDRPWPNWRRFAFHLGSALVFVGLVSPLDALADHYLFSAHMVQHLLFLLASPLLWLLGIPSWAADQLLPAGPVRRAVRAITQPGIAGALWVSIMWIWHIPQLYDAALAQEGLHIVEHLMFLGAGLVGWWPAFGPFPDSIRSQPRPGQVLYLFLVTLPCTALAAFLTLPNQLLYGFYGEMPRLFGLSPLLDQQLGGLLMWLPGDMILVGGSIALLARWMGLGQRKLAPARQLRTEVG